MIKNTRNRIKNRPARNFAIAKDAPAIVVNPRSAAITPTTRNTRAMWSMVSPPAVHVAKRVPARMAEPYNRTPNMDEFLAAAIEEAERGRSEGGIPIGAVLVHEHRILGRGHNRRVQRGSAVLHGEMDALERAGRQAGRVYRESVLFTTLSPCAMCSGAILLYGIPPVVVGENRTFMGEEELLRARGVIVEVLDDERCIAMMAAFIREHPQLWHEDIGR